MKLFRIWLYLAALAIAGLMPALIARGQGVDNAMLLNPPADSWPGYHGDYSGRRHSSLTQITPRNVGQLSLAWAFQSGQSHPFKCSPLLVDGIIYVTVPDNVWALDARSGHQLWHYTYPPNKGFHIGSRGVAMYKESLFFMTPDAHLICLNANNGKVKWDIVVADWQKGYWTTMTPLIVGLCSAEHKVTISGARADPSGKAQLPGVPPGTYYFFCLGSYNKQLFKWDFQVQLKPGANSVTLDQHNAVAVN